MHSQKVHYAQSLAKLNTHIDNSGVNHELQNTARLIVSQVEHIHQTMKKIPIMQLTKVLDAVCLAVIDPSPGSAIACWDAAQDMLTYHETEPRSLAENLLVAAGTCCAIAGVALLASSAGSMAPAAGALFLASKVAMEASEHLQTPKSTAIDKESFLEFKKYITEFRQHCISKESTLSEEAPNSLHLPSSL